MKQIIDVKPCPFCGKEPDMEDPDTIYPNGIGWRYRANGFIEYVHFREVPNNQWCYSLHCVTTSGGCGVEMYGNSVEEFLDKWKTRIII